jgi:peptidoglycan pentaglycine glycine transferase (the first glycine)
MPVLTAAEWDEFLARFPQAHLLQTARWGELKAAFGWEAVRVAQGAAGAQVLFRRLPLGLSLGYIGRGPVWGREGEVYESLQTAADFHSTNAALLEEIDAVCRKRRAVFLKVEPDLWESAAGGEQAPPDGLRPSVQSIQPPRTILLDLTGNEEQILSRMKQKTRYNIRLAHKKGVTVRPSADLETFHLLMQETGGRDSFGVHSLEYYQRAYDLFAPVGQCELLLAEYEGEPLAALMVFAQGDRAWYFYGASSSAHRERMPAYLLQWEAMRWARARGCQEYDLWGVPDADEGELEENFTQRSSGLWGVYRFKRGFGGDLRRAAGPWDRVYQPALYALYRLWAAHRQEG